VIEETGVETRGFLGGTRDLRVSLVIEETGVETRGFLGDTRDLSQESLA